MFTDKSFFYLCDKKLQGATVMPDKICLQEIYYSSKLELNISCVLTQQ